MIWNWLRRHPWLIDGTLVLVVTAANLANAARRGHPLGLVFALGEALPLILRRRLPTAVLVVVGGGTLAEILVSRTTLPFAAAVAVYTAAAHLRRRDSLTASSAAAALIALAELVRDDYHVAIASVLVLAIAWVIGDNLGTRRAYTQELELRAERLEREREAEAARAVAEEQARIARELHDVVAHNVSVMVVQAAAGLDAFDDRPGRAREALEAVESSGRSALTELRRLLGAVRDGDPDFEPQPGLAQVADLVERVRGSGLEVVLRLEGNPQPLPPALELSAFRVVQEALTNTLKHAGASRADVSLRYGESSLDVAVRDDGCGAGGNGGGAGKGLIGMRERVGAYGGALAAGPASEGGYAVEARFPL